MMAQENTHVLQSPTESAQTMVEEPKSKLLDFNAIDHRMSFRRNADFTVCAGTVTINKEQVLLVLNKKYHEDIWQLPKGRKNLGEDIRAAAIRETHEETGYRVRLVPVQMPTRATRPRGGESPFGVSGRTWPQTAVSLPEKLDNNTSQDPSTEPVGMVTWSEPQDGCETDVTKISFFYLAALVDPNAAPDKGTQDPGEKLEARWMSVLDARLALRFEAEREALLCADALRIRSNPWMDGSIFKSP